MSSMLKMYEKLILDELKPTPIQILMFSYWLMKIDKGCSPDKLDFSEKPKNMCPFFPLSITDFFVKIH